MKYLTRDQVVKLQQSLIETSGGSSGIRDEALVNIIVRVASGEATGENLYQWIYDQQA